jgi:hypothetical protein
MNNGLFNETISHKSCAEVTCMMLLVIGTALIVRLHKSTDQLHDGNEKNQWANQLNRQKQWLSGTPEPIKLATHTKHSTDI